VEVEKSLNVDMASTAEMLRKQPAKHSATMGMPDSPAMMAMAAPSAPPADTPRV